MFLKCTRRERCVSIDRLLLSDFNLDLLPSTVSASLCPLLVCGVRRRSLPIWGANKLAPIWLQHPLTLMRVTT
jgi:hypothetical protein